MVRGHAATKAFLARTVGESVAARWRGLELRTRQRDVPSRTPVPRHAWHTLSILHHRSLWAAASASPLL
eukprot:2881371-Rhodomonas_salina.6